MKKKIIREYVDDIYTWGYGCKIDQMIERLQELQKDGTTHVDMEVEERYGYATLEVQVHKERLETDEELQHRINQIASRKESKRKMDLAQLKKLKEEYE